MDVLTMAAIGVAVGAVGAGAGLLVQRLSKTRTGLMKQLPGGLAIIGVVGAGAVMMATGGGTHGQVEQALSGSPPFQVMKTYYPTEYAAVSQELQTRLDAGESREAIVASIRPRLWGLVARQLPMANDENAVAVIRLSRDEAAILRNRDPHLCVAMLSPTAQQTHAVAAFPPDVAARESELIAAVLRQTAAAPDLAITEGLPPSEVQALSAAALKSLPAAERADAEAAIKARGVGLTDAEARGMCDYVLGVFDQVLALPGPRRAATVRAMLGSRPGAG